MPQGLYGPPGGGGGAEFWLVFVHLKFGVRNFKSVIFRNTPISGSTEYIYVIPHFFFCEHEVQVWQKMTKIDTL